MMPRRHAPRRHGRPSSASRAGFTVVELLLTIALMVGAMAMAAPMLSDLTQREDAITAANGAVDSLQQAQSSAMTGLGAGSFGVHFQNDEYVLFTGTTYSATDMNNVVHALSGQVSISGVTLSDGGSDVLYANHKGTPTETGTIVFTGVDGTQRTVTVGAAGVVEVK